MTNEQILREIREVNLTYLMLAQRMINLDKTNAQQSLSMTEDVATKIGELSQTQIHNISSGSMLLCRFRVDDDMVWNLLTNHSKKPIDTPTQHQVVTKNSNANTLASKFAMLNSD
jgi:flagellar transcriptional activator FlhD